MSIQLILQPQNVQGFSNGFSVVSSDMISNGITFGGVNAATGTTSTVPNIIGDLLNNYPATIPNTWYKFRNDAALTYPTEIAGFVVYSHTTADKVTGIYQQLSNLIVGQVYTAEISADTGALFILAVENASGNYNNNVFQDFSTTSIQFTAQITNPQVFLYGYGISASNTILYNISITGANQLVNILSGDGQVICDLYEDEDLPLTLSVDEFKNVAEQVQSYSKAFNLPSTKRNNRIFDAIFEITRADDGIIFNAYRRTECVLKQDGFILFEGFLRLLDVTDKEGEISYNVNLYSEVIALADYLKDFDFKSLDFTELEHDYNKSEIKRSWNDDTTGIIYTKPSTSGFRNAFSTVKYPFVNWNHQLIVAQNSSGSGPVNNNIELPSLETAFRPFINIKYLIDRIFNAPEIPFSYSSEFFNTSDFKKLYMDFNWGSENFPIEVGETITTAIFYSPCGTSSATTSYAPLVLSDCTLFGTVSSFPANYNTTTNVITSTVINENYNTNYEYSIKNYDTVTRTLECQWLYNNTPINYTTVITLLAGESYSFSGSLIQVMANIGDTLQAQFRCDAGTAAMVRQVESTVAPTAVVTIGVGVVAITTNTMLQTLRGELGQWEFLKGLITMFNLVTLPDKDNPNNIKIEPYADVFLNSSDSVQLDWTEKIDVAEMKLTPLTDLNKKTIFKFVEDDDDYSFNQYKNLIGGHLYGSYKSNAGDSFTLLEGTDEIVAEPFAATIIKPIMSQFTDFITPAIYARGSEDEWEGFENSPRIMYNNGIKDTGTSYYIPPQNGGTSSNTTDFLQFSHLSEVPSDSGSTTDFHFETQQMLTTLGTPPVNNLYSMYWQPYFNELYNPNTRTMTIKVNLSAADINTFKFNDTVYLKNRTFRVNKIDYKPNDLSTVEFILIT